MSTNNHCGGDAEAGPAPRWKIDALRSAEAEITGSSMFQSLGAALRGSCGVAGEGRLRITDIEELVVYGLGTLEPGSVNPRYQLALALLLARHHATQLLRPILLYDPVFTAADRAFLKELGCDVIEQNEGGARRVGGTPTLFYLPHCESRLCDALLAANWSPGALSKVLILGNSFSAVADRWDMRSSLVSDQPLPSYLLSLVHKGLVEEHAVSCEGFPVASAFNDMALHSFPGPLLRRVPQQWWERRPEANLPERLSGDR